VILSGQNRHTGIGMKVKLNFVSKQEVIGNFFWINLLLVSY